MQIQALPSILSQIRKSRTFPLKNETVLKNLKKITDQTLKMKKKRKFHALFFLFYGG